MLPVTREEDEGASILLDELPDPLCEGFVVTHVARARHLQRNEEPHLPTKIDGLPSCKRLRPDDGDNSWEAEVHEEYWVRAKPYQYSLCIESID